MSMRWTVPSTARFVDINNFILKRKKCQYEFHCSLHSSSISQIVFPSSICQNSFYKIAFYKISFHKKAFYKISFYKKAFYKISFYKKAFSKIAFSSSYIFQIASGRNQEAKEHGAKRPDRRLAGGSSSSLD